MLLLLFSLLAGAAAAFLLFKFATVDGDLTLVSRGQPRRERVDGKVVWITGASRGIGEVLAMQFASLGAKLILSARNKEELERVKHSIVSKHPDSRVEVLPMDLSSGEESLKEVVHAAELLFSNAGVDYMIHNAAFERPKRGALEETEEGLKATFSVNVFGTITLTRLLAPSMMDRGMGHFVVMSSAAGKVPSPGQALYSASKHALNGYFASLRSELCTKGIKVTVVCPGPIETPQASGTTSSSQQHSSEKRVSVERCAELTIVAATHGLKEAWISYQQEKSASVCEVKGPSSIDSKEEMHDAGSLGVSMELRQEADSTEQKLQKEETSITKEEAHDEGKAAALGECQGASSMDVMNYAALSGHSTEQEHQTEESNTTSREETPEEVVFLFSCCRLE